MQIRSQTNNMHINIVVCCVGKVFAGEHVVDFLVQPPGLGECLVNIVVFLNKPEWGLDYVLNLLVVHEGGCNCWPPSLVLASVESNF